MNRRNSIQSIILSGLLLLFFSLRALAAPSQAPAAQQRQMVFRVAMTDGGTPVDLANFNLADNPTPVIYGSYAAAQGTTADETATITLPDYYVFDNPTGGSNYTISDVTARSLKIHFPKPIDPNSPSNIGFSFKTNLDRTSITADNQAAWSAGIWTPNDGNTNFSMILDDGSGFGVNNVANIVQTPYPSPTFGYRIATIDEHNYQYVNWIDLRYTAVDMYKYGLVQVDNIVVTMGEGFHFPPSARLDTLPFGTVAYSADNRTATITITDHNFTGTRIIGGNSAGSVGFPIYPDPQYVSIDNAADPLQRFAPGQVIPGVATFTFKGTQTPAVTINKNITTVNYTLVEPGILSAKGTVDRTDENKLVIYETKTGVTNIRLNAVWGTVFRNPTYGPYTAPLNEGKDYTVDVVFDPQVRIKAFRVPPSMSRAVYSVPLTRAEVKNVTYTTTAGNTGTITFAANDTLGTVAPTLAAGEYISSYKITYNKLAYLYQELAVLNYVLFDSPTAGLPGQKFPITYTLKNAAGTTISDATNYIMIEKEKCPTWAISLVDTAQSTNAYFNAAPGNYSQEGQSARLHFAIQDATLGGTSGIKSSVLNPVIRIRRDTEVSQRSGAIYSGKLTLQPVMGDGKWNIQVHTSSMEDIYAASPNNAVEKEYTLTLPAFTAPTEIDLYALGIPTNEVIGGEIKLTHDGVWDFSALSGQADRTFMDVHFRSTPENPLAGLTEGVGGMYSGLGGSASPVTITYDDCAHINLSHQEGSQNLQRYLLTDPGFGLKGADIITPKVMNTVWSGSLKQGAQTTVTATISMGAQSAANAQLWSMGGEVAYFKLLPTQRFISFVKGSATFDGTPDPDAAIVTINGSRYLKITNRSTTPVQKTGSGGYTPTYAPWVISFDVSSLPATPTIPMRIIENIGSWLDIATSDDYTQGAIRTVIQPTFYNAGPRQWVKGGWGANGGSFAVDAMTDNMLTNPDTVIWDDPLKLYTDSAIADRNWALSMRGFEILVETDDIQGVTLSPGLDNVFQPASQDVRPHEENRMTTNISISAGLSIMEGLVSTMKIPRAGDTLVHYHPDGGGTYTSTVSQYLTGPVITETRPSLSGSTPVNVLYSVDGVTYYDQTQLIAQGITWEQVGYIKVTNDRMVERDTATLTIPLRTDQSVLDQQETRVSYWEGEFETVKLEARSNRMNTYNYVPFTISGIVWDDDNEDGVKDADEDKWPDMTVNLWQYFGTPEQRLVDTTTTDATGHYTLTSSQAVDLTVEVVTPDGVIATVLQNDNHFSTNADEVVNSPLPSPLTEDKTEWHAGIHPAVKFVTIVARKTWNPLTAAVPIKFQVEAKLNTDEVTWIDPDENVSTVKLDGIQDVGCPAAADVVYGCESAPWEVTWTSLPWGVSNTGVYEYRLVEGTGGVGEMNEGAPTGFSNDGTDNRNDCTYTRTGHIWNCAMTNIQNGWIKVTKSAAPASGIDGGFSFNLSRNTADGLTTVEDFKLNDSETKTFELVPGAFTLTEAATTSNPAPEWAITGLVCADPTNNTVVTLTDRKAETDVAPGETVSCTFTQQRNPILTLENKFEPTDAAAVSWSMTATNASGTARLTGKMDTGTLKGSVEPGKYTLSETADTTTDAVHYSPAEAWTCVNNLVAGSPAFTVTNNNEITLGYGDDVTCSLVNIKNAFLTVQKIALPAANPTEFAILAATDDGTFLVPANGTGAIANGTNMVYEVKPGTYSVTETVPEGWIQTANTCKDVVLTAGQEKTCIITNIKNGKLTVQKTTLPAGDATEFTILTTTASADGGFITPDTGAGILTDALDKVYEVRPGTYTVTETVPDGWLQTASTCAGVVINPGEEKTCLITNVKNGHLIVNKATFPANDTTTFTLAASVADGATGGFITPTTGAGTVTTAAAMDYEVKPGTYTVTETLPDNTNWVAVATACANVAVAPGKTKTCTIINTYNAEIRVTKKITPDRLDADTFAFTLTGNATPKQFSLADDNTTNITVATPGKPYVIAENLTAEQTAAGWVSSAACTSSLDANKVIDPAAFTPEPAEVISCTYNNFKRPILTLVNTVVNGANTPADWTLKATGTLATPTNLSGLTGTADVTGKIISADTYTLSEEPAPGKTIAPGYTGVWSCVDNASDPAAPVTLGAGDVLTLGAGQDVTCTLTNTYTIPLTGAASAAKVWVDGAQPDHVAVPLTLYRRLSGVADAAMEQVSAVAVITPADGTAERFEYRWSGLETTSLAGVPYTFFFTEPETPNYGRVYGTFETVADTQYGTNGVTVTNTYASPTQDVFAAKKWIGLSETDTHPSVSLTLRRRLLNVADSPWEAVSAVTVDGVADTQAADHYETQPWVATWKAVPVTDRAGAAYAYEVAELSVPTGFDLGTCTLDAPLAPEGTTAVEFCLSNTARPVKLTLTKVTVPPSDPTAFTFHFFKDGAAENRTLELSNGSVVELTQPHGVYALFEVKAANHEMKSIRCTTGADQAFTPVEIAEADYPAGTDYESGFRMTFVPGQAVSCTLTNGYIIPLMNFAADKQWNGLSDTEERPQVTLTLKRTLEGGEPETVSAIVLDGTADEPCMEETCATETSAWHADWMNLPQTNELLAGYTYAVEEAELPGFAGSDCTSDADACLMNTAKPGSLTIIKETQPADDAKEFELSVAAKDDPDFETQEFKLKNGASHGIDAMPHGGYILTEKPLDGWVIRGVSCVDAADQPVTAVPVENQTGAYQISVGMGQAITCTITSAALSGLTIIEDARPDTAALFRFTLNGPNNFEDTFDLVDDGSASTRQKVYPQELEPGEYTLTQTVMAPNYHLLEINAEGPRPIAAASYRLAASLRGMPRAQAAVPAPVITLEERKIVFTLAGNQATAITFVNVLDSVGTIIVDKKTYPEAAADEFQFQTTDEGYQPFSLTDVSEPNRQIVPPGTYTLTESKADGWFLLDATCRSSIDNKVWSIADVSAGATISIPIKSEETVTCTFINVPANTIAVEKRVLLEDNPTQFEMYGKLNGKIGNREFLVLPGVKPDGTLWSVREKLPILWKLNAVDCLEWGVENKLVSKGDKDKKEALIGLDEGEVVRCTFTNEYNADQPLPDTGFPTGDRAIDAAVVEIPRTGFSVGEITPLMAQTGNRLYHSTSMTLLVPGLNLALPILGVPLAADGWDLSWLSETVGWLEGSAYPTWQGNTVLTAHVWDANNHPGPFAGLKSLVYGDVFYILANGLEYAYEVRTSERISAKDVNRMLQHADADWVTLITCEAYDPAAGNYPYRRMVRAVLTGKQ